MERKGSSTKLWLYLLSKKSVCKIATPIKMYLCVCVCVCVRACVLVGGGDQLAGDSAVPAVARLP
jgi:hypothetical protein